MKLNYSILWLDDKIEEFTDDGWIEEINQHLTEEGFEPKVIPMTRYDDFIGRLDDSFDLILTDFHMTSKNGDEVVKEIREKNIQTEILFYTAQADLPGAEKLNRITFLQTSGSHHSEVVKTVKDLINLTIKKFQHIIAMRGMIMHETSSLDSQITRILSLYFESNKFNFDTFLDSICSKLECFLGEKQEYIVKIKENKNYKKLLKDTFLFSAEYKVDAMRTVIEQLALPDFTEDYKNEVSGLRNKFAHAVLEEDKAGRQYFRKGDEGITFDEVLCKKLRKDINKHRGNIDNLESELKKAING